MKIACFLTVGFALLCLTPCMADESDDPASSMPTLPQVETRVIEYLNDGDQKAAEKLLEEETSRYLEIGQLSNLKSSQRAEAEAIIRDLAERHGDRQRLFFLLAACYRSRFETNLAIPLFCLVYQCDPQSAEGKCALHVLHLDSPLSRKLVKDEIDHEFLEFALLADENPEDPILRWMAAVQCRNWDRNQEGALHYKKILEIWKPGPVLVHQTYANLLDQLQQYEDALVERRQAVKMEPAGWSYDGLANTLRNLKRYQEATEAHIRAVRFQPKRSSYWSNWASTFFSEGNYAEAIAMAKMAIDLDSQNRAAWKIWEMSLTWQGHLIEAKSKSQEANFVLYGKNRS